MVVTPSSLQVWIMWWDIDMCMGQHHLTVDELDEAVAIYKRSLEEDIVVNKPPHTTSDIRAGTPVCKLGE